MSSTCPLKYKSLTIITFSKCCIRDHSKYSDLKQYPFLYYSDGSGTDWAQLSNSRGPLCRSHQAVLGAGSSEGSLISLSSTWIVIVLQLLSRVQLFFDPSSPPGLCPWNSPGKKTGVGCRSLLQGNFLTQGSNLGLLHFQVDSLPLNHQHLGWEDPNS